MLTITSIGGETNNCYDLQDNTHMQYTAVRFVIYLISYRASFNNLQVHVCYRYPKDVNADVLTYFILLLLIPTSAVTPGRACWFKCVISVLLFANDE